MSRRSDFCNPMGFDFMNDVLEEISKAFDVDCSEFQTVTTMRPFDNYPLDIVEKDKSYDIMMNVPGFKKEDIDIDISDNTIKISSNKEETKEENVGKYILKERSSKSFNRSFKIPTNTVKEDITAKMEDGVLYISIPKVEKVESSNKINID